MSGTKAGCQRGWHRHIRVNCPEAASFSCPTTLRCAQTTQDLKKKSRKCYYGIYRLLSCSIFPHSKPTKLHIRPHSDTHEHRSVHYLQDYNTLEQHGDSPLTEGVQAGQNFGVLVAVQTYAADQELLVNLADHGTGKSGAFTGHPKTLT